MHINHSACMDFKSSNVSPAIVWCVYPKRHYTWLDLSADLFFISRRRVRICNIWSPGAIPQPLLIQLVVGPWGGSEASGEVAGRTGAPPTGAIQAGSGEAWVRVAEGTARCKGGGSLEARAKNVWDDQWWWEHCQPPTPCEWIYKQKHTSREELWPRWAERWRDHTSK